MAFGAVLFDGSGAVDPRSTSLPIVFETLYHHQSRNPQGTINGEAGKAWMDGYLSNISDGGIESAIRDGDQMVPPTEENVLRVMQRQMD